MANLSSYERRNELPNDSQLLNPSELPLVSICIPAYNSEVTLGETLDSILAQDYPRLDIVVSDNQSTDNTKEVIQKYAECGVRYCWHDEGRPSWAENMPNYIGGFANWNYVLSQGRGEYLCLFHSDDLYDSSIVRQQVKVMQAHPQVGVVFTRMQMIGEDSCPIRLGLDFELPDELSNHPTFNFSTLLNVVLAHTNIFPTPSAMLRRSVVEQVGGFDERQFFTSADLEMWLRIANQGYEIAIINQPLLKYRVCQRQFGSQYNRRRTISADVFNMLDHYLNQPRIKSMVLPKSIAQYELFRANDEVLCSLNLLIDGKVTEARERLRNGLHWQSFLVALKNPLIFVNLTIGAFLQVCIFLGFGPFVGRGVYFVYFYRFAYRRKNVSFKKIRL